MANQCVHCGKIIESGSREILEGCFNCKGKFFFYIRDDQVHKSEKKIEFELNNSDKQQVEKEIRSILKIEDEDEPVVLDLESVRALKPGKFEIDLVGLMNRKPIVFKSSEGRYFIDLEGLNKLGK